MVDLTNVTTQGYWAADVGQPKVQATAAAIRQLDPAIAVEIRPGPLPATHGDRPGRLLLRRLHRRPRGHLAIGGRKVPLLGDGRMLGEVIRVLGRGRRHRPRPLPHDALRPVRGPARPLHRPQHDLRRQHRGRADGPPVHPLAAGHAGGPRHVAQPPGRGVGGRLIRLACPSRRTALLGRQRQALPLIAAISCSISFANIGDLPLAITITRRLASQLRAVMRRAFGTRGPGPAVCFTAAAGTLSVKAMFADIAVEYAEPGERHAPKPSGCRFQLLDDCEGKKDEPVHIEATGKGRVTAQWRDGSVPQIVHYDAKEPRDADKFPGAAVSVHEPIGRGSCRPCTTPRTLPSPAGVRFATDCLQLCPDGSINATDGRQLLVQSGFTFPWEGAVLVPRNKVFDSSELPQDQPVAVAQSGDWAVISAGPWTVYLRINKDGRFPDLSRHVPNPDTAAARCQFSKDDIRFLAEALPKLPCDEKYNFPVTLDLNGQVAIRAKTADQAKPTEVLLTNSHWTGQPIRINMNRTYLQRAMRLGLQDLCIYGDQTALLCQAFDRKLVWMPLDPKAAIPPAEDAIRIESPQGELAARVSNPVKPRRTRSVSEPTTNTNGKAATNGHAQTNGHDKTDASNRKVPAARPPCKTWPTLSSRPRRSAPRHTI